MKCVLKTYICALITVRYRVKNMYIKSYIIYKTKYKLDFKIIFKKKVKQY